MGLAEAGTRGSLIRGVKKKAGQSHRGSSYMDETTVQAYMGQPEHQVWRTFL